MSGHFPVKSPFKRAILAALTLTFALEAGAQMRCEDLFKRETPQARELREVLAHIREQGSYDAILEQIVRLEARRDRLRRWNGRTEANYMIRRRRLLHQIESLLRRGEQEALMNKLRVVYRPVEIEFARLQAIEKNINEIEPGLNGINAVDVLIEAQLTLAKLKMERQQRLRTFGIKYGEYIQVRGFIEETISKGKIVDSNQYLEANGGQESAAVASRPTEMPAPGFDPLSPEARLKLYVDTAREADRKIGIESLKSWLPQLETLQRRPTRDEIKQYFKDRPEALIASLRYQANEELFTFLKFAVNRSSLLLKGITYRLPEQIKGIPIRAPITDALGLSYDMDLITSYSDRITEINRSAVSTAEKYALLLKKAAGAPPDKFYETFARMPDAAAVFQELKQYTKNRDNMVYKNMLNGETIRLRSGDLSDTGSYSPADRAYRIALAIAAGSVIGYMSGIGDGTINAIQQWLDDNKDKIEDAIKKGELKHDANDELRNKPVPEMMRKSPQAAPAEEGSALPTFTKSENQLPLPQVETTPTASERSKNSHLLRPSTRKKDTATPAVPAAEALSTTTPKSPMPQPVPTNAAPSLVPESRAVIIPSKVRLGVEANNDDGFLFKPKKQEVRRLGPETEDQ